MIKQLLTAALLMAPTALTAQIAEVSSPKPLLRGVESEMYYPVLSADGRSLTFSDLTQTNIRVYDFNDNVTSRVSETPKKIPARHGVSVQVDGSKLIIDIKGHKQAYTPVDCYAGYLWPSVSPDGTMVMFVAAGKGVYITDLKGNIIANPGKYEAPVWFGNNHIVVMNATDDGHQYQSSRLILMTRDGSQSQALTKPESMSMFPTANTAADRIIYNTIDGRLYQLDVKLK